MVCVLAPGVGRGAKGGGGGGGPNPSLARSRSRRSLAKTLRSAVPRTCLCSGRLQWGCGAHFLHTQPWLAVARAAAPLRPAVCCHRVASVCSYACVAGTRRVPARACTRVPDECTRGCSHFTSGRPYSDAKCSAVALRRDHHQSVTQGTSTMYRGCGLSSGADVDMRRAKEAHNERWVRPDRTQDLCARRRPRHYSTRVRLRAIVPSRRTPSD